MKDLFSPSDHPHRRYNPLTDDWVLVSPHRAKRPWQGQVEDTKRHRTHKYDPDCYLCPTNKRISGDVNPDYTKPYVFANDHPALLQKAPAMSACDDLLFKSEAVCGEAKVVCYSPDHSKTLPELSVEEIEQVINTWQSEITTLGKKYQWVQCFENKGSVMGCSNPHPHGQIWACDFLPNEAKKENDSQFLYYKNNNVPLLVDYALRESEAGERTVVENDQWIAVVPHWASWPFEILLLPKKHIRHLTLIDEEQSKLLASALKILTIKYDNLFQTSFPYSMGWHGMPLNGESNDHWQLHAHFYPPLLRSATIKKFMVGFEMLAEVQRDLTPEQAASRLRDQPVQHYLSEEN